MASLFKKVDGIEEEKDTLGGSKFGVWNTGSYEVIIDSVYLDQSSGGAYNLNFVFKTNEGKELKETMYVTSGTAKGQLNYYVGKDGKKHYLPGYNIANGIALLATGKELADLEPEEKIVEIYNYELKKNAPTKKLVYMDLIGKSLVLGVFKVKEFKRVKDDATGSYVDSDEIKELNEINKVFSIDGKTTTEYKAGSTGEFINKWIEKYNDEFVKDKTKGKTPAKPTATTTGSGTPSLFGN